MHQPGLGEEVVMENGPTRAERMQDPDVRPAPFRGQHTREICRSLLGLSDREISALVDEGVLEEAVEVE
jgi:crotonobetainyl-CoA:carnitine CoA-transferase CaiB-like acyl-CoA transferase